MYFNYSIAISLFSLHVSPQTQSHSQQHSQQYRIRFCFVYIPNLEIEINFYITSQWQIASKPKEQRKKCMKINNKPNGSHSREMPSSSNRSRFAKPIPAISKKGKDEELSATADGEEKQNEFNSKCLTAISTGEKKSVWLAYLRFGKRKRCARCMI